MNYFSHLHIAKSTQTSYAGSLLGDFSVQLDDLQDDLLEGWKLHQKVDVMVDDHPQSVLFRTMARKGRRRFSGIVQDIVMDYWLIQNWSNCSSEPLQNFCDEAVLALSKDRLRCPERLQTMILSLERRNWLADLGTEQGVRHAIMSIMQRWRHGAYLQPFLDELPDVLLQGEEIFSLIYPDVLAFAHQCTCSLKSVV